MVFFALFSIIQVQKTLQLFKLPPGFEKFGQGQDNGPKKSSEGGKKGNASILLQFYLDKKEGDKKEASGNVPEPWDFVIIFY